MEQPLSETAPVQAPPSAPKPGSSSSIIVKAIGGLVAVGLIAGAYMYFFQGSDDQELELTPQSKVQLQGGIGNSDAANGWSTQDDPQLAVTEAIAAAKAKLAGRQPRYAYVASTSGYDHTKIMAALKDNLASDVKIHGLTSALGVMTNEGLHMGNVGAVAVLLVASPDITFGVSGIEMDVKATRETAKTVLLEAIKDAGKTAKDKPDMIIVNGPPRRGDDMEMLDGIADIVGKEVPVIGGTAGNETNDPTWRQFVRDTVYTNGLIITTIYTDRKVGWDFQSGFRITDKGGKVTKSQGKIIYEIDGRPALDVYSEWVGPELMQKLETNDFIEITKFTALNPLSIVIKGQDGQLAYYSLHPVPSKNDILAKTLPLGGSIPQGSEIRLFSSTWQTILSRAESVPSQALLRGELKSSDSAFGLMILCRGAANAVPANELPKVPLLTNNVINGVPFVGVISRGEQGPIEGIRNVNANLVESIVIIGKQ